MCNCGKSSRVNNGSKAPTRSTGKTIGGAASSFGKPKVKISFGAKRRGG